MFKFILKQKQFLKILSMIILISSPCLTGFSEWDLKSPTRYAHATSYQFAKDFIASLSHIQKASERTRKIDLDMDLGSPRFKAEVLRNMNDLKMAKLKLAGYAESDIENQKASSVSAVRAIEKLIAVCDEIHQLLKQIAETGTRNRRC